MDAALPRCGAVWATVTAGTGLLLTWLVPVAGAALTGPPPLPLDRALVGVCAAAAIAAACWLWLVTGLVVVAAARGRSAPVRGVPTPLRTLLLAACGVALTAGLTAPAQATPGQPHQDRAAPVPGTSIAGLPLPDRASSPLPGGALVRTGPLPAAVPAEHGTTVVVAAGDSLWAIAGRDLGPGAADASIEERWQQIYQLNRAAVGPDPDLIRPAQRLRLPLG